MRHLLGTACIALGAALVATAPACAVPIPIHEWTFDDGTARDVVGGLNGSLGGDAYISNGKLVLDGQYAGGGSRTYMATTNDIAVLSTMTLVSWVSLATPDQGGGSALSVVDDGQTFNAIDYNEIGGNQWINGSDYFSRTNSGNRASVADPAEHMMAIT